MKQITAVSTSEITRYAVKNIVKNNSDVLTSISKATELEVMKKRMMRGEVVKFAYMKLNGEVRIAIGTLQADAVKANVVGTGIPKRFTECLPILIWRKCHGVVSRRSVSLVLLRTNKGMGRNPIPIQ